MKKEERTFKPNLPVCKIARSMIVYWVENGFCVIDQYKVNLDILNRFISDLQQNKNQIVPPVAPAFAVKLHDNKHSNSNNLKTPLP